MVKLFAIRTQMGHRDSSLSSKWRYDAPQVVRASDHNFLHNDQFVCLTVAFSSTLKMPLSQSPLFREVKPFFFIIISCSECRHCVLLAPSIFLAGDSTCQWPCIPACFFQPVLETYFLNLLLGENIPTCHELIVLFPSFFKAFHGAPVAPRTLSTANLSVVFSPFALREWL